MGAGYGALTKFLLERFPNATAICQDGSEEMAKLGRERMKASRRQIRICPVRFRQTRLEQTCSGTFRSHRIVDRDP